MKDMKLFILVILFVAVVSLDSIVFIHIITNNEEPAKEKTVEEIKENEEIKKLRSLPFEHGDFIEVKCTNNNLETGAIDEIIFKRINSSFRLFTYERDKKGSKTKVVEYTTDPTEYLSIINYFTEYNLPAWSTLPQKDNNTKVFSNKTVTFTFDDSKFSKSNNEVYLVDFKKNLPDGGTKILSEFINLMYNSLIEKNKINEKLIN